MLTGVRFPTEHDGSSLLILSFIGLLCSPPIMAAIAVRPGLIGLVSVISEAAIIFGCDGMKIGKRIHQARKAAGLTKGEMATRAGIPVADLLRYENGEELPGSRELILLARAAGVKVEYFFRTVEVEIELVRVCRIDHSRL